MEPPTFVDDDVGALLPDNMHQLEHDDFAVLTSEQLEDLLKQTTFMRTSSKNMSGVFVNDNGRVLVVRLIAQIAEDMDLIGSLKFVDAGDVSRPIWFLSSSTWQNIADVNNKIDEREMEGYSEGPG